MDQSQTSGLLAEEIINDGSHFFTRMEEDLEAARVSIDLEFYIFSDDAAGQRVSEALIRAAQRGVRVRLLVDGVGSYYWGGTLEQKMAQSGIEVKVFHPLPWHFWKWKEEGPSRTWIEKVYVLLTKINTRNHRKMVIVDGRVAWVGSYNISAVHLPKDEGGGGWRDSAARVEDGRVWDLIVAFEKDWSHPWVPGLFLSRFRYPRLVRLNSSHWRRTRLYRELLFRIMFSKERILVTSPYFIPEIRILNQLKKAAERGIEVKILLPRRADVPFMTWSARCFYQDLLGAGVKIFEYLPSVLHAKVLIIDSWVTVGSSNMNHRSAFNDLEVDLVILAEASQKKVIDEFHADLKLSESIEASSLAKSAFYNFLGRLILTLRVLL